MTIRVPFQLRRRALASPAVALLVPARDPAELFAICAHLSLDPSGRIFEVAPGFLLELERPATGPLPGTIRLRELTKGLYLPADAELVPALLDDEATGLVRDRGLVFLPGGRALAFDRHTAVEVGKLLEARPRPRRIWTALPEPPRLSERLDQIALELPEQPPEALYRALTEEVRRQHERTAPEQGEDRPGSDQAGQMTRAGESDSDQAGDSQAGCPDPAQAGRSNLGAAAGGLVSTFGDMIHNVQHMVSRSGQALSMLKEKIQWEWVDHSALLKKLVREFREGDEARALRRAIPFARPDEPWIPVKAHWLPWGRAIYSLAELLRRPGRGQATPVRFAREDVTRELAREYRKAAERAVKRGDFRRAAYIYGILLGDDHSAASALQRGGLHHDAAILYLRRLNDRAAAAGAFEAAGQVDRALVLYRQLGHHETAADLLRRLGDEEAALAEYAVAAQMYANSVPPRHLAAGLLMEKKARRLDVALKYLQTGWDRRPAVDALLCALEMARLHAERGAIEPIRTLFDEADALFESSGSDSDAGSFYNAMLSVASFPALKPVAEELRDRSVLALARKLRCGVEAGRPAPPLVSTLFGRSKDWPAALVSDADFAATASLSRSRIPAAGAERDPSIHGFQIGRGVVTAACQAPASGELFIGFDSGLVLAYRPERNQVMKVAEDNHPVTALAVDPEGQTVVALRTYHHGTALSRSLKRPDGSFRLRPDTHFPRSQSGAHGSAQARASAGGLEASGAQPPGCWLTPVVPRGVERLVGVGWGHELSIVDASSGLSWGELTIPDDGAGAPTLAILLAIPLPGRHPESRDAILTHVGPRWILVDLEGKLLSQTTSYRWLHTDAGFDSGRPAPVTWRHVPPFLEVLGVDRKGAVYAAQFLVQDDSLGMLVESAGTTEGGYLAAVRVGTSKVVAVARTRIDWLNYGSEQLNVVHKLKLGLPSAVACFASPATEELLVVCSDGFIAHVAPPRRMRGVGKQGSGNRGDNT